MAKRFEPEPQDEFDPMLGDDAGYAEEPPEIEEDLPRRAASARFIVDAEVGSEAMLRDAMDPANQSLADALRLSFRVLQAVIVVLIVLFLGSGFRTVEDGHTGVKTVWGRISDSLAPGPQFSVYPYPVAEFVTFRAENRTADLGEYFTTAARGRSQDAVLETTDVTTPIHPGRDGSLITRDGDLAHLEVAARYEIEDPIEFVHRINDSDRRRDADEIVKMAMRRAAVHVVAKMSLTEVTDSARQDEFEENLRIEAQRVLDDIDSGVRLVDLVKLTGSPPVAIAKAMGDVSEAQVMAADAVETATKQATATLNAVAGAGHTELLRLIREYEFALDSGEQAMADQLLEAVNARFESAEISGEVTQIINRAYAYRSQIDATLGNEVKRFESLLPAFRANPRLVVQQLWLESISKIHSQPLTEVMYVPEGGSIKIMLASSQDIQGRRRDERFKEQQEAVNREFYRGPYVATGDVMSIDRSGRQLKLNPKTGRLEPVGAASSGAPTPNNR